MTCSVEGCERGNYARTMCRVHYDRWLHHGTTDLPVKVARECSVNGCERGGKNVRGMCEMHYLRWKKHGTTDSNGKFSRVIPAEVRIMSQLVLQPNGCMHWTGLIDKQGYGRLGYKGRSSETLQRAVYDCFVGPIPPGLFIDHLCHTNDLDCPGGDTCLHRRCGNRDHLEPVTLAVNNQRGSNTRKTACVNGHDYTPENTYRADGRRYCVACYILRHGHAPARMSGVA